MSQKSVTLARALKEKNRVAGVLATLRNQIASDNSRDEESPRDVEVEAAFSEALRVEQRLIEIKTAIAEANKEIVGVIVALEETKSEIAWLSSLDTTCYNRRVVTMGEERIHKVDAVITGPRKIALLKDLQKRANALQDQLDDYNSSHRIVIEVED